jgi:hypothetical protein
MRKHAARRLDGWVNGMEIGEEKKVKRKAVGATDSIAIHDLIPSNRKRLFPDTEGQNRPKGASKRRATLMRGMMNEAMISHLRVTG